MQAEVLKTTIYDICRQKSEGPTIELKAAHQGCPTKLFDTLSSFSNQDDGGTIIFGIDESKDYTICGVYDPQDLQKKVAEQCKQMEPPVRALFTVCDIDNKCIVSAEIPGVEVTKRPVFYRGVGRLKGSYVRVGDSDEPMSEYEIYSYEAFRQKSHDDMRPIIGANMNFFDKERMANYLAAVKSQRRNLADSLSDEQILELMGITLNGVPTVAGALVFSKYPQTYFPQLSITAVALPGKQMGEIGGDEERFLDSKRMTGAIPDMLEEAVEFIRKNSRIKTIINEDGRRIDKPEYPMKAVREAILNALVHRDYSIHTENIPIQIEMYRDRMEIINAGGLYGKITVDALGKVRPETRNTVLANILELLKITENRYSGIPTMRREFACASLPSPVFSALHGEFKVIMRNDYYKATMSTSDLILEYCVTPRTREEIINLTGKSRTYTMVHMVYPLVEQGKLQLTLPEKPKSSKQKYVKA